MTREMWAKKLCAVAIVSICASAFVVPAAFAEDAATPGMAAPMDHHSATHPQGRFRHHHRGHAHHSTGMQQQSH